MPAFHNPVAYPFRKTKTGSRWLGEFSTFDTETDGLGGELICITFYSKKVSPNPVLLKGPNMIKDFMKVCEKVGGIWFAHNLSYDLRNLLGDYIDTYGNNFQLLMRSENNAWGADITYATHLKKPKKYSLRDSMALFPTSLKEFAESFSDIPKSDIDNIGEFDINNDYHRAYALNDALCLHSALTNYNIKMWQMFKVSPRNTISSTAVKAWQEHLNDGEEYYASGPDIQEFERKAYYGGLTGLTSTRVYGEAWTYDVNSAYPAVMRAYGVPYRKRTIEIEPTMVDLDSIGIVEVTVIAPDDLVIPILPCREEDYMVWRRGIFTTVVTIPELKYALTKGYKVVEYHKVQYYERMVYPFKNFVDRCEKIRYSHDGTPIAKMVKILQSSLYGKFAPRQINLEVIFRKDYEYEEGDNVFSCEFSDKIMIKKIENSRQRAMPIWAAWITAQTRLHMLQVMYDQVGVENVIYYDTDSFTATVDYGKMYPDMIADDEYGAFKLEKHWSTFRAIAPKVYAGTLYDSQTVGRAKGIPKGLLSDKEYQMMINGEKVDPVEFTSVTSLGTFMKSKKNVESYVRSISDISNSKSWVVDEYGNVRPRYAEYKGELI